MTFVKETAGFRIEGYVIVSAEGMLANADRVMPDEMKFEADKTFFTAALDRADLIVHGRHSQEDQPNAPNRKRIILTQRVRTVAPDPENAKATLWNPSGSSFDDACAVAGVSSGTVAIIGGPRVFDIFMDRYDTFWLSEAPKVRVPGGEPVFPGVPRLTPRQILAQHELKPGESRILDEANGVTVTPWRRTT